MCATDTLIASAVRNHTSWMTVRSLGTRTLGGLTWLVAGTGREASIPFPSAFTGDHADAMLADLRDHGACGAGCWTSGLDPIGEIAAVLVARGFEWGWQAHWMAFDLDGLPPIDDDRVTVAPHSLPDTWRAEAPGAGQALVHLAGGDAGLYDVHVEPAHRGTGLGRALTVAALRAGRQAGAQAATTNATEDGTRLYASLGAQSLGYGQTFWIHRNGLASSPTPELVAAAEAAGRGEVPTSAPKDVLSARLPGNGLTLPEVAELADHRDAAEQLAQLLKR